MYHAYSSVVSLSHGKLYGIYISFHDFTYNTRGNVAVAEYFSRPSPEPRKIRAMSKMSARIICKTIE